MNRVGLLDVNVLVALFDPDHIHHEAAHLWFGEHRRLGWATCPLTENGLVRVITNPAFKNQPLAAPEIILRLTAFRASGLHSFWPDEISVCDPDLFRPGAAIASRHLTDAYLLALAVRRRGRLVTFDRGIPTGAIVGVESDHLAVLTA